MNLDDNSNEEDMDVDPTAKRAENAFYQNPDDQLHFRDMDDNIESVASGLIKTQQQQAYVTQAPECHLI